MALNPALLSLRACVWPSDVGTNFRSRRAFHFPYPAARDVHRVMFRVSFVPSRHAGPASAAHAERSHLEAPSLGLLRGLAAARVGARLRLRGRPRRHAQASALGGRASSMLSAGFIDGPGAGTWHRFGGGA